MTELTGIFTSSILGFIFIIVASIFYSEVQEKDRDMAAFFAIFYILTIVAFSSVLYFAVELSQK